MIVQGHRLGETWRSLGPVVRGRLALGVVGVGLLVWVIFAAKPWDIDLGPRPKLRHLVAVYTWWAAAFSLGVTAVLAVLVPWWAGPVRKSEMGDRSSEVEHPRWFWPLVVTAMLLTAWFSYPRLQFGFWDDEELCARESLAGKFRLDDKSGQPRFLPLKWEETFFGYRTPNNHVLYSVLARGFAGVAGVFKGPQDLPFSESALRFPAFIFGLLGVAALAWFLKEAGFAAAGVVAAFLLALHPWYIRYASEARGYSLILFLVPMLLVFWRRAIVLGGWNWWAACATVQFAMLYTYPGMLFLLVTLNVLTLPALALSRGAAGPFRAQSGRWFFSNTCAALAVILLMLPLIPQARIYFDFEASRQIELGWPWVRSALSFLLAGVPWAGSSDHISLGDLQVHQPILLGVVVGMVGGLLALGLIAFSRRSLCHGCVAVVFVATPVLTFLLSRERKMLIYESYILYALPGLIALIAVGVVLVSRLFLRLPGGRVAGPVVAVLLVVSYAALTHNFRQWIAGHPLQQIRESVQACRPEPNPLDPRQNDILTASFCIPPYLYDAHLIRADSADEFIAILKLADQTGKPLYINIGMPWAAEEYSPRMWAMFSDDKLFGERKRFLGFDAGLNRLVARYKPGSAAAYDFSALRGAER